MCKQNIAESVVVVSYIRGFFQIRIFVFLFVGFVVFSGLQLSYFQGIMLVECSCFVQDSVFFQGQCTFNDRLMWTFFFFDLGSFEGLFQIQIFSWDYLQFLMLSYYNLILFFVYLCVYFFFKRVFIESIWFLIQFLQISFCFRLYRLVNCFITYDLNCF